jgi:antitoxin (DNA-binding transcriptional repressor) of toxin-antitoxin stability system
MVTVTIEEVLERLPDLLENVQLGEDVLITKNDLPFARLSPALPQVPEEPKKRQRQLGLLAGKIILADDYETPLDDFKDYL